MVQSHPLQPRLGETPQGEAVDCNSIAATLGRVRFPPLPPILRRVGLLGDGRLPFKEEITGSKPVRATNNASNCLMERQAPDKRRQGSSIPPRSTNSHRTTWRWSLPSQGREADSSSAWGTNLYSCSIMAVHCPDSTDEKARFLPGVPTTLL